MISYRELANKIYEDKKQFIEWFYYEETPNYPHKFHIFPDKICSEEAYDIVAHDLHELDVPGSHLDISAWTDVDSFLDYLNRNK